MCFNLVVLATLGFNSKRAVAGEIESKELPVV
jgi:hypothetical protein